MGRGEVHDVRGGRSADTERVLLAASSSDDWAMRQRPHAQESTRSGSNGHGGGVREGG